MARGRMITNEITRDKKINDLSDDTSRLAFTWLITFADSEGRTHGDPVLIRNMLFPRRDDITTKQMTGYITEWANAGLIIWYESNGDKWISFPNFERHQPNMRKDREPASVIPAPLFDADNMTADCRMLAGYAPEHIPVKRREEKRIEEKRNGANATNITALQAERIYQNVTDLATFPSERRDFAIDAICKIAHRSGNDTEDYLKPFWVEWCKRKNRNGRPYPKTSVGWLDWAIAGDIPAITPKPEKEKSFDELLSDAGYK